jgi:hypothetical protein
LRIGIPVRVWSHRRGRWGPLHRLATSAASASSVACACVAHAGLLGGSWVERRSRAAWVRTPRGPEPLLACYRQSARETIRREIDAGRLKASDLDTALDIAAMGLEEVERFGPADRLLANINTPDDWERIRD